jgi:hypothetical protein
MAAPHKSCREKRFFKQFAVSTEKSRDLTVSVLDNADTQEHLWGPGLFSDPGRKKQTYGREKEKKYVQLLILELLNAPHKFSRQPEYVRTWCAASPGTSQVTWTTSLSN